MEYLFIGGTGRCGTTITFDYLGNNSKIYPTKTAEIKVLTAKNGLLDLYNSKNLNNFNDYIKQAILNKDNGYNSFINSLKSKDILTMLDELNKNFNFNNKESIKQFYNNCFYKQNIIENNIKYLADSTPESIPHSDRIVEIIPNSKFIHMIRDGRDSAYSEYLIMKNNKFYNNIKNEFDGLNFWYKKIVRSFNATGKLDNKKYINIRLEDFVIYNNKNQKEKIINFLEITNEIQMESFYLNNVKDSSMSIGQWKKSKNWKEYDERYSLMLEDLKQKNIFIEKYY